MKQILMIVMIGAAAVSTALWADPPARVGRLSFLDGSISWSPSAGETPQTATLNLPLTAGNLISTGAGARAEVHIGSSAVRLASGTSITFESLDDQAVQIRLDTGSMSVGLRTLGSDQSFQVDTQTASVSFSAPGLFRVDQAGSGDARVTSRSGTAQVTGGQAAFSVGPGQSAEIPLSGPDAERIAIAPQPDSWDEWVAQRNARETDVISSHYVSREMVGVEDLDDYGSWRVIIGYGPVWVPRTLVAGWAPYAYGHWIWLDPWGWTWVDNEPWGFAPFHYGRWIFTTGSWCWVPGPIVARPVFFPALVRWTGGTPWRSHPPDRDHIGWVPLRPGQAFRPSYHASVPPFRPLTGPLAMPLRLPPRVGPAAIPFQRRHAGDAAGPWVSAGEPATRGGPELNRRPAQPGGPSLVPPGRVIPHGDPPGYLRRQPRKAPTDENADDPYLVRPRGQ